jgi:diguanylate cyclase (GGDEF)-like protein
MASDANLPIATLTIWALVASTDGLTGIANRRTCEQTLAKEWRRAIRLAIPIAHLMLDGAFFETFNDTCEHPVGDDVLGAIADAIIGNVRRPTGLAGHYGGEEFMAILPETK